MFEELDSIYEYVKNDSPQNAEILVERLITDLHGLAFMPGRCPKVDIKHFHGGDYRKLLSHPYLIYFRIDDITKTVFIVTVRHGARKPL